MSKDATFTPEAAVADLRSRLEKAKAHFEARVNDIAKMIEALDGEWKERREWMTRAYATLPTDRQKELQDWYRVIGIGYSVLDKNRDELTDDDYYLQSTTFFEPVMIDLYEQIRAAVGKPATP